MLAGEPFSDRPATVCPVIAGFMRAYNRFLDDGDELPQADLFHHPYSVGDAAGDHSFVWNGFYMATVTGQWPTHVPVSQSPIDIKIRCPSVWPSGTAFTAAITWFSSHVQR